jgi:hypothetical protein
VAGSWPGPGRSAARVLALRVMWLALLQLREPFAKRDYANPDIYDATVRHDMCLQLIPGLSKTVKTTSLSRVPSNEALGSLCQCENIQVNGK